MLETIQIWFISDNALGIKYKKNAKNKAEKSASWQLGTSFLTGYVSVTELMSLIWCNRAQNKKIFISDY